MSLEIVSCCELNFNRVESSFLPRYPDTFNLGIRPGYYPNEAHFWYVGFMFSSRSRLYTLPLTFSIYHTTLCSTKLRGTQVNFIRENSPWCSKTPELLLVG